MQMLRTLPTIMSLKKIWDDSRQLAATTTVDENRAWKKFQATIHPAEIKHTGFGWVRFAAAIILIAAVGFISYLIVINRVHEITFVARQAVLNDTLPDGS